MELSDDYEHVYDGIFYIAESIPTNDTKQYFEEQIRNGCSCETECSVDSGCSCLTMSGCIYNTTDRNNLTTYSIEEIDDKKPIYECNSRCKCSGSLCGNRLVQFGPRLNLTITDAGKKGYGLTTTRDLKKGNFICEYAGEIISKKQAEVRHRQNCRSGKMNYIFCVSEHYGDETIKTFIDPSIFGNVGRYINHSCEPNCGLYVIRVDSIVPKLCIFTKTDVKKSTELTFDYGNQNSVFVKDGNLQNGIMCLCNMPTCKKYLPYCPTFQ